jgi:hypothetical protein
MLLTGVVAAAMAGCSSTQEPDIGGLPLRRVSTPSAQTTFISASSSAPTVVTTVTRRSDGSMKRAVMIGVGVATGTLVLAAAGVGVAGDGVLTP